MVSMLNVNSLNHILFRLIVPHADKKQMMVIDAMQNNLRFKISPETFKRHLFIKDNGNPPPTRGGGAWGMIILLSLDGRGRGEGEGEFLLITLFLANIEPNSRVNPMPGM